MTPKEVQEYFKSGYKFHKFTKMSANSLGNWLNWGYVPYLSQKKIESLTNGKLAAVWSESEPKEVNGELK